MAANTVLAMERLRREFVRVPDRAKPATFWWWFNNHVSRAGITRDLEEFRAKGLGGVLLIHSTTGFRAGPIPRGPEFLSTEWRALFRHALQEANRLGLEVGVNLSTGWVMGGPWIRPEDSGRWLLQSSVTVEGPADFSSTLPLPDPRNGYEGPGQLFVKDYIDLPLALVDYRDSAVVAFPAIERSHRANIGDRRRSFAAKTNRRDSSSHVSADEVMQATLLPWPDEPEDEPVPAATVTDLTDKVDAAGILRWDVPAGRWTILRTGHRMTGARTAYALPEAAGLEVDWLGEAGVEAQFLHLGQTLLDEAGALAGSTLRYFHTDSFEDGYPNWTQSFLSEFRRRRGYDPTLFLPVFHGHLVGSAGISDRFLYDYRRTVADCMADLAYGRLADLCHAAGLLLQSEAAGPSWSGTMCMDGLRNLGRCDLPMGEFWQNDNYTIGGQNQVSKMVASAAHTYGRRTASAEAFTTMAHWSDPPEALKRTADRAFCEGINRLVIHSSTSTRPEDGVPGYEYGAGTHFNPNITWWRQAGPFLSYLGRCQYLLQEGLFVADVLYYNGDWAPNLVREKHEPTDLGRGYDYDVCNSEVLLTRTAVRDGRIVLPDGLSYRLLVLPPSETMPIEVARKVRDLYRAGATILGPRPIRTPGLGQYPEAELELQAIAAELWDAPTTGQRPGRVLAGMSARAVLRADGIPPDLQAPASSEALDWVHRQADGSDWYFLVNRTGRTVEAAVTFRIVGRQPEIWHPVTGEIRRSVRFTSHSEGTTVPVELAPHESMFVVFGPAGEPVPPSPDDPTIAVLQSRQAITGPWSVQFDSAWGGPGIVEFEKLVDWTTRSEEGIRHYSGTASYRNVFDLQALPAHARVFLDLGSVKNLAHVQLNGRDLGVLWTPPWRFDITDALQTTGNQLEIHITNLWPNRLLRDAQLPSEQRLTRTNIALPAGAKPLPSGLLGPVELLATLP